jgi:heme/copper-type cytochrome/quinol oxidase subunit 2
MRRYIMLLLVCLLSTSLSAQHAIGPEPRIPARTVSQPTNHAVIYATVSAAVVVGAVLVIVHHRHHRRHKDVHSQVR